MPSLPSRPSRHLRAARIASSFAAAACAAGLAAAQAQPTPGDAVNPMTGRLLQAETLRDRVVEAQLQARLEAELTAIERARAERRRLAADRGLPAALVPPPLAAPSGIARIVPAAPASAPQSELPPAPAGAQARQPLPGAFAVAPKVDARSSAQVLGVYGTPGAQRLLVARGGRVESIETSEAAGVFGGADASDPRAGTAPPNAGVATLPQGENRIRLPEGAAATVAPVARRIEAPADPFHEPALIDVERRP